MSALGSVRLRLAIPLGCVVVATLGFVIQNAFRIVKLPEPDPDDPPLNGTSSVNSAEERGWHHDGWTVLQRGTNGIVMSVLVPSAPLTVNDRHILVVVSNSLPDRAVGADSVGACNIRMTRQRWCRDAINYPRTDIPPPSVPYHERPRLWTQPPSSSNEVRVAIETGHFSLGDINIDPQKCLVMKIDVVRLLKIRYRGTYQFDIAWDSNPIPEIEPPFGPRYHICITGIVVRVR